MATAPGGISYSYDALGRLATRAASAATTSLAYSGTAATRASDGTTRYSYGPGGGLIGFQRNGGPAQSALTNPHGDVTGAFSPATGTSLSASAAYSPYGTVTATSGTMPSLGYQGQYTDPATGNVNMAARWYSPVTGSFTSNDTLAGSPIPASINRR
jgi:large repetitive protein